MFPVSGGQTIGAGEGVRIDVGSIDMFRLGSPWEPGDSNNPDDFDIVDHDPINEFQFEIIQVVGSGSGNTASIFVEVFDANDNELFNDDTPVVIGVSAITVFDGAIKVIDAGVINPIYDATVNIGTNSDGVWISGLEQGWDVRVDSATGFDRIEISDGRSLDVSGDNSPANFSIGDLTLLASQEGGELTLNYNVEGTDGDGDAIEGEFDIVLAPNSGVSQIGTDAGETINGNGDFNSLYGLDGDDTLVGNGGDDFLDGGEGSDILWGDDTAQVGPAGADTFRWASVNDIDSDFDGSVDHVDTVKDYSGAGDGDVLDISDLLTELGVTDLAGVPAVFQSVQALANVELQVNLGGGFETFAVVENTLLADIVIDNGGLM